MGVFVFVLMRSEFVFIYLAGICLSYLTDNLYLMHGFFTGPVANTPSLPPPNPTVMTTSLPTTRPLPPPPPPSTPRSMVSFLPSMSLGSMILLLRAGSHCRPTRSAFTTCPEVTLRTLCCCQSQRPPLTLLTVSPVNSMSLTRLVVNPL